MITTNDAALADRAASFRNHGLDRDFRERGEAETWAYEMVSLGFNYRLSDIQCALGLSQLAKCEQRRRRREEIALQYREALSSVNGVQCLKVRPGVTHSWHLFVIRIDFASLGRSRQGVFTRLRNLGIGVNVHYLPVHLHQYYRDRCSTQPGLCPNAEAAYEEILSLPIHARMSDLEVARVIEAVWESLRPDA